MVAGWLVGLAWPGVEMCAVCVFSEALWQNVILMTLLSAAVAVAAVRVMAGGRAFEKCTLHHSPRVSVCRE